MVNQNNRRRETMRTTVHPFRWRRAITVAVSLVAATGCAFPDVPGDAARGSVTRHRFHSAALGHALPCLVYLPPGGVRPREALPVVYLLHGWAGDEDSWFAKGRAHETADRLIAAGAIPRMILVAPDGDRSFYVNSARGAWEDALALDLPAWVESTLGALVARDGRALVGNSMGGWGALQLGLSHPDRYAALASLSGVIDVRDFSPGRAVPPDRIRALSRSAVLPAIYADCGTADRHRLHMQLPALQLALAARRTRMPWLVHFIPGRGHDWGLWRERLEPALRFVARFLRDADRG